METRSPLPFYRLYTNNKTTGSLELFDTQSIEAGESNWFESLQEVQEFLNDHFIDHQPTEGDKDYITLFVVPVYTVLLKT